MNLLALVLAAAPVWSGSFNVATGGAARTLKAKGLVEGTHYELVTHVSCVTTGPKRTRKRMIDPTVEPFGVEFRVSVGAQEFPVDEGEKTVLFRADRPEVEVKVEDHSSASLRTKCTLSSVEIRALEK